MSETHDILKRVPFVLPNLGTAGEPITAMAWFAATGGRVLEGDRLLEVMIGDAIIDIPSPATGQLLQKCVEEDDRVEPGQILGYIQMLPRPSSH